MRILFIIPYVPSLVRVRPYQIIRHLKERGHHITLATIVTNPAEELDLGHFRQFCDEILVHRLPTYRSLINCVLALPTKLPLQSVYSWNTELFSEISDKLFDHAGIPQFDIIHIEHLRGSQYGVNLLKDSPLSQNQLPPIIWDSVDCISYLFKQAAAKSKPSLMRRITQFDLQRTERREGELPALFDHVLVTSRKDKEAFLKLDIEQQEKITVLPNGVDLDYFRPGAFDTRENATLVVSGKMSYHANINMVLYLVKSILPIVRQFRPDLKLWVVGKDPPKDILALAADPSITVTGYVDSILPYLTRASIAVAPLLYGAGIQNKVLEAMACGTPVVTTPQAISALNVDPGNDILVGQTPEDFAQSVLDLLDNSKYRKKIGDAGRSYVEQNHNWVNICQQLENLYAQKIKNG